MKQLFWRLGLTSHPRAHTPGYSGTHSDKRFRHRRGYRRSLSPSDLVPTKLVGTTSTEVRGPDPRHPDYGYMETEYRDTVLMPDINVTSASQESEGKDTLTALPPLPNGRESGITRTFAVDQEIEEAPRLYLRDSFRYSFARGSILSLGRSRMKDLPSLPSP